MYASDWLFALFSNIIPLSQYHHFLTGFFSQGWSLFYKFSLSYMRALKPDLLQMTDLCEILFLIKLKHVNRDEDKDLKHSSSEASNSQEANSSSYIGNNDTSYSIDDEPIQVKIKGILNKIVEGKP